MKKVIIISHLLVIILTYNVLGQKLKFKKIDSHKTEVYLYNDNTNDIIDTLELNSIYSDNSYSRNDSSIFFVKKFATMTSVNPIAYYFYEYKIKDEKFIKVNSINYILKICNRETSTKTNIRLIFKKRNFSLCWIEGKRKKRLIVPISLFSLSLMQDVLPECWK